MRDHRLPIILPTAPAPEGKPPITDQPVNKEDVESTSNHIVLIIEDTLGLVDKLY